MRPILALSLLLALAGCGPKYSPDTYATNAAQQANKVDTGVVVGVRKVRISAQGTAGAVSGAAAGGVAGSQLGAGPTSAFGTIGGSLLGGIAGVASEHLISDTDGYEYIVRKPNGELVSVVQNDEKPLKVGQKVLVIAGPQARIVADYTIPFSSPATHAPAGTAPATAGTAAPSGTAPPGAGTSASPAGTASATAGAAPSSAGTAGSSPEPKNAGATPAPSVTAAASESSPPATGDALPAAIGESLVPSPPHSAAATDPPPPATPAARPGQATPVGGDGGGGSM